MITVDLLKSVCKTTAGKAQCAAIVPLLNTILPKYDINTKLRTAMFLAQALHESGEFTHLSENLNYSSARLAVVWPKRFSINGKPNQVALDIGGKPELIANTVYANRLGNGTPESGDGWKYRGRGIFQLTGKDNYTNCGKAIHIDIAKNPDLLLSHEAAITSACWFWQTHNINSAADKSDIVKSTKIINGGNIGIDDRTKYFNAIMLLI